MNAELVAAFLALAVVGTAGGQEPTPQSPAGPAASPSPAPGDFVPTKDLLDILRELRHKPPPPPLDPKEFPKRMVALSPVLGYSPTSGVSAGFAGNVAFYKGYPVTTRISSVVTSANFTSEGQFLVSAKINASSLENRWRLEADNRFYWTSQETYGLGTNTQDDAALDMKYTYIKMHDKLYRQLRKNLFLGVGGIYSVHNKVRRPDDVAEDTWSDSPYLAYSEQFGFEPESQTSAGFSLHALVDSRDGAINPSRGFFASASYLMHIDDFLGADSTWQQFSYDIRAYARLSRNARHKLAFWTFGDLVTSGVAPYLDLPSTGADTYARSGRGYPQGRFRGEQMLYAEAEYRWTITGNGLFGMVAFLNTETLSNEQAEEKLFDSFATGAGIGFRFMLNKRSKTNLCFDVGWGRDGSKAVYFAVQEAF